MDSDLPPREYLEAFFGEKPLSLLVQGQWVKYSDGSWHCTCAEFARSGKCEHVDEAAQTFEDPDWRIMASGSALH